MNEAVAGQQPIAVPVVLQLFGPVLQSVQRYAGMSGNPLNIGSVTDPTPAQTGLAAAGTAAGQMRSLNRAEAYNAAVDGPALESRSSILSNMYSFRDLVIRATTTATTYIVPQSRAVVSDARQVWNAIKDALPRSTDLSSLAAPLSAYFLPQIQQAQDTKKNNDKVRSDTTKKVTATLGDQARVQARTDLKQRLGDGVTALLAAADDKSK